MKSSDKMKIEAYRENGVSYAEIAEILSLPLNTVKSYCKRHNLGGRRERTVENISLCLQCGTGIPQNPHRKIKKFCSDSCRSLWWRSHNTEIHRKSEQIFICPVCKKEFNAYRSSNQKFCSRACYGKSRGNVLVKHEFSELNTVPDCHGVGSFPSE